MAVNNYFGKFLSSTERNHIIAKIVRSLAQQKDKFDTIAVRGYSMAAIAPIVAYKLNKQIAIIRKPGESSHSAHKVESEYCENYIIIDDFIASGDTIKHVVKAMDAYTRAKCYGVYLYNDYGVNNPRSIKRRLDEINAALGTSIKALNR